MGVSACLVRLLARGMEVVALDAKSPAIHRPSGSRGLLSELAGLGAASPEYLATACVRRWSWQALCLPTGERFSVRPGW
jgi:hypothetical protein